MDRLVADAATVGLNARGTVGWDEKLNLNAWLLIAPKVKLPKVVSALLISEKGGDRKGVGFKVTGTLSNPSTDFLDILSGKKIGGQIQNLLQSVGGKGKKK